MIWEKKGKICDSRDFDLPWFKSNIMVPLPYLVNDSCLRIFVGMCDQDTVSRVGYVDVRTEKTSEIIGVSEKPLIDIGDDGCFDDNGVVTASIIEVDNALYMYYSGYQTCVKVPYLIFTGVAVSYDRGNSFKKVSARVPILDRIDGECGTRCVPFVIKAEDKFRMWYTADADSGWVDGENKKLPLYNLKHCVSESPVEWPRTPGKVSVGLKGTDEHGIAKCTLWQEDGLYKIIYSIRNLSKMYRLGYAESVDGIEFLRKDDLGGIDVSASGWDSEMIAFAERIEVGDKTYLFYCGNHYGRDGMGYAELVSK